MAKKIRWTTRAIADRTNIYKYWLDKNNSKTYSEKLEYFFNKSAEIISVFPQIGRKTDYRNVYVKVIKDFKIFYMM